LLKNSLLLDFPKPIPLYDKVFVSTQKRQYRLSVRVDHAVVVSRTTPTLG
jgi:hypothetical protein